MPAQRQLLPPATLDDMYQSLNDDFRAAGLAPLRVTPPPDITTPSAAPQRAPNHAAAPQTTPPQPNLQNEATAARPRPKRPQTLPFPATPSAPPTRQSAPPTRQSAPPHANAPHKSPACETNPPLPAPSSILSSPSSPHSPRRLRPLTPNQLRAARLLIVGQSTTAIAAALHIDRHTLADWKRLPLFQQELRHLLDQTQPPEISRGGIPPSRATATPERRNSSQDTVSTASRYNPVLEKTLTRS